MTKQELEVYSDASNAVVVRAPGRKFPGVVIQGDTLFNLWDSVASSSDRLADDELAGIGDELYAVLSHYQRVMEEHGLPLPYHRAV